MRTILIAGLLACVTLTGTAKAEITWTGNTDPNNDGDWSVGANWTDGAPPGPAQEVILPDVNADGNSGDGVRTITVDAPATVGTLTVTQETAGFGNDVSLAADLTVGDIVTNGENHMMHVRLNGHTFTYDNLAAGCGPIYPVSIEGEGGLIAKNGSGRDCFNVEQYTPQYYGRWSINNGIFWIQKGSLRNSQRIMVNNGGTLEFNGWGTYAEGAKALVLSGPGYNNEGVLHAWDTRTIAGPVTFLSDPVINVDASQTLTLIGNTSGGGGLTKIGQGTLILSGLNNYSSSTTVAEGTLQANSPLVNSPVVVEAGATLLGPPMMYPQGVTGPGTWSPGPDGWFGAGDPNNNGLWSVGANWTQGEPPGEGDEAIMGDVKAQGNSGSNVRTIMVDEDVTIATLNMAQYSADFYNDVFLGANLTVGKIKTDGENHQMRIRLNGHTFTYGDLVTDSKPPYPMGAQGEGGLIVKNGSGRDHFNVEQYPPQYYGSWAINNGIFWIEKGSLQNSEMITVNAGGTLEFNGSGALAAGAGALTLNGAGYDGLGALHVADTREISCPVTVATDATINTSTAGNALTLTGAVDGSGVLTKTGPGTLLIEGICRAGETLVSEGVLGGTGVIAALAVNGGATLAPGPGIGRLTCESRAALASVTYQWEIDDALGAQGANWDLVDAGATLDLAATPESPMTIEVHSLTTSGQPGLLANFDSAQTYSWTIARAGAATGFDPGAIVIDAGNFWNELGIKEFSVVKVGASLKLVFGSPLDGDCNDDCRVNILDLIFIRNRLGQAVSSGDNWKADVTRDGKINILDLIYVRNRLNTKCEGTS